MSQNLHSQTNPQRHSMDAKILINDFLAHLGNKPLSKNQHNHFLVACMPKSGSTWLANLISQMLEIPQGHLVTGYEAREQELAVDRLLVHHQMSYVAQHHLRYSQPTHQLIEQYHLKPVVLFRNIYDIVMSLVDFIPTQGAEANTFAAYMEEKYTHASPEELTNLVVDHMIPWYIRFYLNWQNAGVRHIKIFYEDLLADPEKTLAQIMAFYEVDVPAERIRQAINKSAVASTRKNKAVAGRGQGLSDEVKERIKNYTRFYKDKDFSPIGL